MSSEHWCRREPESSSPSTEPGQLQYDAGDRLTQIVDSLAGTITRTWDDLDRLTQEVTPQGTVSYTYDAAGRRTSLTVTGQPTVTYGYDDADRLTQITQGTATVSVAYDAAHRRTALTLPNGVVTEYAYDAASRLTGLTYRAGSTPLGDLSYGYDTAGSRVRVAGTWARTGLPAAVVSATYDAANRQLTFGGQTLTYDLNGNLTGDGTATYTWDARNRLVGLTASGMAASFQYDGLGRRTQKTINGTATSFVYDGLNPVQELAGGGVAANLLTGLGIDEYLTRTDAAGARGLLVDALGSTVALTDGTGAVQAEHTYEPFGATTTTGVTTSAFQYTGRENDGTGLYHYRARYYDPARQRFITEDPLGLAAGINVYAYAFNNPLAFVDPEGLTAKVCCRPLAFRGGGAASRLNQRARHCYIVTDDMTTPPSTMSLFPKGGLGQPTPNDPSDNPALPGTQCEECAPKLPCSDPKKCIEKASRNYPISAYITAGPNSNTFASIMANECCANGFPRQLGSPQGAVPPAVRAPIR